MLGNTIILNLHWASVYLIATGLFFWGKSGVPNIDKKKKDTHTKKKDTQKKKPSSSVSDFFLSRELHF